MAIINGRWAFDWLTLRSPKAPEPRRVRDERALPGQGVRLVQASAAWRGGPAFGRYEAARDPALQVAVRPSHGQWKLEFTGQFFRAGGDWREVVEHTCWRDEELTVPRVDVAIEDPRDRRPVLLVAQLVAERLPTVRYGWGLRHDVSMDGETVYIGQRARPGGEAGELADMRSRPLMVRVYRRTGGPLRAEFECKQLVGLGPKQAFGEVVRLVEGVVEGVAPAFMVRAVADAPDRRPDLRQAPAKLLRQAWGLVQCAHLRQSGVIEDEAARKAFARIWRIVIGEDWPDEDPEERIKRERRAERVEAEHRARLRRSQAIKEESPEEFAARWRAAREVVVRRGRGGSCPLGSGQRYWRWRTIEEVEAPDGAERSVQDERDE